MENTPAVDELDASALRDWMKVGMALYAALDELAFRLGGEDFAKKICAFAQSDELLPNPDALKTLLETYPHSDSDFLALFTEMAQEFKTWG